MHRRRLLAFTLLAGAVGCLRIAPGARPPEVPLSLTLETSHLTPWGPILHISQSTDGGWDGEFLLRASRARAKDSLEAYAIQLEADQRRRWSEEFGCQDAEVRDGLLVCEVPFTRGIPDWRRWGRELVAIAHEARPVIRAVLVRESARQRSSRSGIVCADGDWLRLRMTEGPKVTELDLAPCVRDSGARLPALQRRTWRVVDSVAATARGAGGKLGARSRSNAP